MNKYMPWVAALWIAGLAGAAPGDLPAQASETTPAPAAPSYLAPENAPKLPPAPRKYQGPTGFAGHQWGETRAKFTRLPETPQMMRAAWTRGSKRTPELVCTGVAASGTGSTGSLGGVGGAVDALTACSLNDIVRAMETRKPEGAGFHVMSEYKIEGQGFRFTGSGVTLHPVIYQFCAHWNAVEREEPENFAELNQFCGMRLLFDTETLEQLRALPEDHVTRYDLVLNELISRYGKPAKFAMRGKVSIQSVEGPEAPADRPARDREFSSWRWCPAMDRAMTTQCASSIILSIDPEAGKAVVLFATPAMWEYAYASNDMEDNDPLFAVMHGKKIEPATKDAVSK
jgi:hypothetical protein